MYTHFFNDNDDDKKREGNSSCLSWNSYWMDYLKDFVEHDTFIIEHRLYLPPHRLLLSLLLEYCILMIIFFRLSFSQFFLCFSVSVSHEYIHLQNYWYQFLKVLKIDVMTGFKEIIYLGFGCVSLDAFEGWRSLPKKSF